MTASPSTLRLVAIRAAHHPEATPKYDRVVFEFNGPIPLFRMEFVKQLIADGSGLPIVIKGEAKLLLRFEATVAHTDAGQPTAPLRLTPNLPVAKEIVSVGDFEGIVTYGVGLTEKRELRLITMANPARLVIDILV